MTHLPNFYSDEEWNDLSDVERNAASRAFGEAQQQSYRDLAQRIEDIDEEIANTPIEGTSDLIYIDNLRREQDDLKRMADDARKRDADGGRDA